MHPRFLLLASAILVLSVAQAGPLEGELFGYRLGKKYPVGDATRGYFSFMGQAVLNAERAEAPAGFDRVEIITTPKTFTIANIYGKAEFEDEAKAKEFEGKYADLLRTMYGGKCPAIKAYLDEALKLACSRSYELTVHRFKPDKTGEKHQVHVGLKFDNDSSAGKKIISQFKSEFDSLDTEAKRARLDKALREQGLKGLQ
ncbi:MAG: hypothetical protein AB9M53_00305 [Leptothrix sp. (in: b-proteobacteria)]